MAETPKSNTSLARVCILTDNLVVNYSLDMQYAHIFNSRPLLLYNEVNYALIK